VINTDTHDQQIVAPIPMASTDVHGYVIFILNRKAYTDSHGHAAAFVALPNHKSDHVAVNRRQVHDDPKDMHALVENCTGLNGSPSISSSSRYCMPWTTSVSVVCVEFFSSIILV